MKKDLPPPCDDESPKRDGPKTTTIRWLAFSGIATLIGREAAIKLVSIVGWIVLARTLSPSIFGLFAIATFVLALVGLFSDLGLGAAFIRRRRDATPDELSGLFTFQLVVTTMMGVVVFAVAPVVGLAYREPGLAGVLRALAIALILGSLRTVPTILCERSLRYGPVVLSDVTGQLSYWFIAIYGAFGGWGVWSLVIALVCSTSLSTVVLYAKVPWRPSLAFNWRPLRETLQFGVFYQGQSITHFVKDLMISGLGGLVYGTRAVGYLWWAQQLAALPLQLTNLVSRVVYPALARLQDDRKEFSALLESALAWTSRITLPVYAALVGLSPEIVHYVYGPKWLPALPSLYVFFGNMILGIGTGVLMPAIYSTGRAGSGFKISVVWTAITWSLALALALTPLGFLSVALAYLVGTTVAFSAIAFELRRITDIRLLKLTWFPIASGLCIATILNAVAPSLVRNTWSLVLLAGVAVATGLALNIWPHRARTLNAVRSLLVARPSGHHEWPTAAELPTAL